MIVFKFFTLGEYEEKEKWINEMCSKGYALKDCSMCKFVFEKCTPNEYYYSLELLENLSSHPSNEDFLNYLKDEWDIQYICQYRNWVFFRRKRSLGKFDLFPSISSKLYYFKRLLTCRLITIIIFLTLAVLNLLYPSHDFKDDIFSIFLIIVSIIFFLSNIPNFIKYKKLKKLNKS